MPMFLMGLQGLLMRPPLPPARSHALMKFPNALSRRVIRIGSRPVLCIRGVHTWESFSLSEVYIIT